MGGSIGELSDYTNRLVDRARAYGMKVSTEKSKITTSSTNNIRTNIAINGAVNCHYGGEQPEARGGDQFQAPESNTERMALA